MKNKEFFIGWNGELSQDHRNKLRKFLIPVFVLIPILCFLLVYFTKPFSSSIFELGNIKEFTGIYYNEPFPVLKLDASQEPIELDRHALLVGFGKNGAKTYISQIEKTEGDLSGRRIRIQGTLIYGDGKTLIELSKKENSILEIYDTPKSSPAPSATNSISLHGEILDPKCWFGVMKPAEGKVHKSCAIRCISGGIPPVLRVSNNAVNKYYILKDKNGLDINQEVLAYVAEPVEIEGQTTIQNGWNVLSIDSKKIIIKK